MNELKRIEEKIQSAFSESSYPQEFLDAYDQMECLASRSGRETFLVRRKETGEMAVAKCYDRAAFPFRAHPELLEDIRHPGLPRFIEQYRNDRVLCIVREYIEGEPLGEFAKDGQLSKEQIISFGGQMCDILTALHGHNPPVIHRDIKPENIIVRPDGTLALIDFDISRSYRENAAGDTVYFGTRGYAPPEQYGFGQTDSRADIYALGVLLRWMVTGSPAENPNVTIDRQLQRVIDKCTAFSPEDRYRDAEQVRRDLRKKRRMPPLRKLLTAAVVLAAALCAGFALGRFTGWLKPVPEIRFTEPLIERAVRIQAGKESGPLTEEDLRQVKSIYIYGSEAYGDPEEFSRQAVDDHEPGPLRTLDDLEQLPELEEIHIIRQGYLDVSAVGNLPRVHTVEFKHLILSGVQPVARLGRLKAAILFDCGLTDVTALEECPWLETLDIGLNDFTDLGRIGSHPNVTALGAMWLQMDNVDDIARQLPKLQAVTLQHSDIRDLSGLKSLPRLKTVYAIGEQAEALEELFKETGVEIRITEN